MISPVQISTEEDTEAMRCLGFPMVMHQDAAGLGLNPIPPTVRLSGHGHCAHPES